MLRLHYYELLGVLDGLGQKTTTDVVGGLFQVLDLVLVTLVRICLDVFAEVAQRLQKRWLVI